MDGMWKSLPDDCVSNIMSYWSPLNAHQLRVYLILEEYSKELYEIQCHFRNLQDLEDHIYIPHNKYKLYTTLWVKMVKNSKWLFKLRDSPHRDFRGINGICIDALSTIDVVMKKKTIVIQRLMDTPAYMGQILSNTYWVDDYDWREAIKNYKDDNYLTFAQNTYNRNKLCKKVEKQLKTYRDMVLQVVIPLNAFIRDWTQKDKSKQYLWEYGEYL
jgi:hypothetical protein